MPLRLPSLISLHTSCAVVLCCCRYFLSGEKWAAPVLVWFMEFLNISDRQGDFSVETPKRTVNHCKSRSALEEMTVALGRAGQWQIVMRAVFELS